MTKKTARAIVLLGEDFRNLPRKGFEAKYGVDRSAVEVRLGAIEALTFLGRAANKDSVNALLQWFAFLVSDKEEVAEGDTPTSKVLVQ